jgi:hypothetical protein
MFTFREVYVRSFEGNVVNDPFRIVQTLATRAGVESNRYRRSYSALK